MNKTKQRVFTMHHLEDIIHHWPAMSHIQNTAQNDLAFSPYTLRRARLQAVHFFLIIQQTFQVSPTTVSVLSLVKKSLNNPLGEKILTTRPTNPILEPTEL